MTLGSMFPPGKIFQRAKRSRAEPKPQGLSQEERKEAIQNSWSVVARYSSWCWLCEGPVTPGQKVRPTPTAWVHIECVFGGRPETP